MEIYDRVTRWKLLDALWDYNRGRFGKARDGLIDVADRIERRPKSVKKKKRVDKKASAKIPAGFHNPEDCY